MPRKQCTTYERDDSVQQKVISLRFGKGLACLTPSAYEALCEVVSTGSLPLAPSPKDSSQPSLQHGGSAGKGTAGNSSLPRATVETRCIHKRSRQNSQSHTYSSSSKRTNFGKRSCKRSIRNRMGTASSVSDHEQSSSDGENSEYDSYCAELSRFQNTLEKRLGSFAQLNDPFQFQSNHQRFSEGTYVNCDIRYLNFASLGEFDVVLLDPPWRIRGQENMTDEQAMFSNTNFSMEYNTLSTQEILDLEVGCLSKRGLIFLWVVNSQLELGLECLSKWGYAYIDKITWIKKTCRNNLAIGPGFTFLHSTEICLVGRKSSAERFEFIRRASNDIIFEEVKRKSQKPTALYHIIEQMAPGASKVELFARNHNIRRGWLSIGNQLGPHYDYENLITCDICKGEIQAGTKRYKSKFRSNVDLCQSCFLGSKRNLSDYFELKNVSFEMLQHKYFQCCSGLIYLLTTG